DGSWAVLAAAQMEYDELRAYRFRVGTHPGMSYTVADDGGVLARLRTGGGGVWEFGSGGLADRWVWEMALGYDVACRVGDRGAIRSALDYYPRVTGVGQFRLRARVAYEYVIDPASGTFLRVGVQDR